MWRFNIGESRDLQLADVGNNGKFNTLETNNEKNEQAEEKTESGTLEMNIKGIDNLEKKKDLEKPFIGEMKDDVGKKVSAENNLLKNHSFSKFGVEYKTDDNGNIYSIDGKLLANQGYTLDGHRYETDDKGNIYIKDGEQVRLTDEEKTKIKEETSWSDEIIENIKNMKQYEILKNANLIEVEINGRKCLVRTDIDMDKKWHTGRFDENGTPLYKTNRERMEEGKPPLDENGKPIQLHHLGQKADSPLVELTEEEHRTGEYEDGKKNQSLWHDNAKETEVHGAHENEWKQERENHWKARSEQTNGGD